MQKAIEARNKQAIQKLAEREANQRWGNSLSVSDRAFYYKKLGQDYLNAKKIEKLTEIGELIKRDFADAVIGYFKEYERILAKKSKKKKPLSPLEQARLSKRNLT